MRDGRVVLGDYIYDRLRAELIQGGFAPGEQLKETVLAARYEVSRTPIREALRRLENEHLVVRHGPVCTVADFDLEAASELLIMRELLEPYCAEVSGALLTAADVARMRMLSAEIAEAQERGRRAELNNEFHNVLYSRCPYKRLRAQVDSLRDHLVTYRLYGSYTEEDLRRSCAEHEELIELAAGVAAGERDPAELGAAVRAHLADARTALVRNSEQVLGESEQVVGEP